MNIGDDTKISSVLNTQFSTSVENKGVLLQTLALFVFLIAATSENKRKRLISHIFTIKYNLIDVNFILSLILTSYFFILIITGNVSSWFRYNGNSDSYSNTSVVYLTIICLVFTVTEFSRLCKLNCNNFRSVISAINKIYLFDIVVIFSLLMISGNRNEALLIILPPVISYSIFIKYISNKYFLVLLTVGILGMSIIGLTRQTGVNVSSISNSELSLYGTARDFGVVSLNTKYLISYVDKKSPIYFNNAVSTAFSSIPFVGGLYVGMTGRKGDQRSADVTTMGMQSINNMDSGLGTSLIGDLYYTGSSWFVFIYMFLLGKFQAYLYNRFVVSKDYNIWLLLIYLFLFSNVVYSVRAEWTMPFRYLGFSLILLAVLLHLPKLKSRKLSING